MPRKRLTIDEIKRRIDRIKESAGDYEVAHSLEDDLYYDVLRAMAVGACESPRIAAGLAIRTKEIVFPRYTA